MMAGQGTVNVYIDMKNLNENNKTISFAFSNVGKDQKLHFNIQNLDAGTSTALDNNWDITNEGNGKLVTTWKAKDSDPQTLNLTIPLEANPKVVKDKSVVKVGLTITTDNQTVNYPLLTARVKPYEDKVRQDEIVKGFPIGETTVANEEKYGNISEQDLKNTNAQNDQTVLQ